MSLTKNLLLAALAAAATIGIAAPGMASAQSAYVTFSTTTYGGESGGGYHRGHDRDRNRGYDQSAYGYGNDWNDNDDQWSDNRRDERRWDNGRWHHRHHRDGGWGRGHDRDDRYRDYCRHHPEYRGGWDRWDRWDRDNGGW